MRRRSPARWARRLLRSKHALRTLFGLSAAETTVLPVPIEVVLIPYMGANRSRVWTIATVTLAGCVLGALLGYAVGYALFQSAGRWLIDTFGFQDAYQSFDELFDAYGFWAIVLVGVLPIPFQVAMLGAGVAGYSIPMFVLATVLARGARYYGLAALVRIFGRRTRDLWKRHALATSAAGAGLVVGVAVLMQWLAERVT